MFYYYDPTYIFVIIAVIITMIVQGYMTSTFSKYERVESKSGLTASEACRVILDRSNITNVSIGHVSGNLTDHYAPTKKELNLSDTTYNSRSIAAIGVAAHEAGHAIQDNTNMILLSIQMRLVPVVNFASRLSIPVIFIGFILGILDMIQFGIILFSATLVYQLITLPIEFNASGNAIRTLREYNIMDESELYAVKKVLTAAALTYVAAAASTVLQILRFVILMNGRSRRR
ncbi:MAG: zinc metallopeptidase [Lachnospiraceae bacterium]|nr:zinc metallopeptidase [Lachnospiraceae bacterium]